MGLLKGLMWWLWDGKVGQKSKKSKTMLKIHKKFTKSRCRKKDLIFVQKTQNKWSICRLAVFRKWQSWPLFWVKIIYLAVFEHETQKNQVTELTKMHKFQGECIEIALDLGNCNLPRKGRKCVRFASWQDGKNQWTRYANLLLV